MLQLESEHTDKPPSADSCITLPQRTVIWPNLCSPGIRVPSINNNLTDRCIRPGGGRGTGGGGGGGGALGGGTHTPGGEGRPGGGGPGGTAGPVPLRYSTRSAISSLPSNGVVPVLTYFFRVISTTFKISFRNLVTTLRHTLPISRSRLRTQPAPPGIRADDHGQGFGCKNTPSSGP